MCDTDNHLAETYSGLEDRGESAGALDDALLDDIVLANRILFNHNVVDGFGHVSVRHPADPSRYILARNMAPNLVTRDDLVEFDLDSNPVTARGRPVYLERFLHGEIYRRRPDVMAVVHSHAPAVVPFGVVRSSALRPIWHMSAFLPNPVPVFEIRDDAGDSTDLLIRSPALGRSLAESLGDSCVVLMRGHGATVTGDTLRQVVFRAVYTHANAELQLQANGLGDISFLTEGESASATKTVGSQDRRAWDLWARQAGARPE